MAPYVGKLTSKIDADAAVSELSRDMSGQLPDDIYNTTLPRWRAAIRTYLVKAVARESPIIAHLQVCFFIVPCALADMASCILIGISSVFLVG